MASLAENTARAITAFDNIKKALAEKGITVEDGTPVERYSDLIDDMHSASYDEGLNEGYSNGFNEGKQAEYDAFWDSYQDYGNKTNYSFAFAGACWNIENFRPKYSMKPTNMYMFTYAAYGGGLQGDVVERLAELGITLDTSKCANFQYAFSCGTHWGVIDTTATTNLSYQLFFGNKNLHTIDELIVKEATTYGTYTFSECNSLVNLKVTGTIGQNGFNIKWSTKLNSESIESIISALSDTATGKSITLPTTAKATYYNAHSGEYSDEDSAWSALIGTKSNWTIVLATV